MSTTQPLRVLIVEDSADDAALLLRELERGGYAPAHERVDTLETLTAALARQTWDVIFADFAMPGFSGTRALAAVRERGLDVPFIFVSGTIGEDTAVAAMKAGAQDYLMKDNLKRLLPALARELREAEGRRERVRAEERLHYLARHDALTDLPNRTLLYERVQQAMNDANADGRLVALLFLDLDQFKRINDTLGHRAGDVVVQTMAARLAASVRHGDTVARLGGDDFAIVLAHIAQVADVTRLAQKIIDAVAPPFALDGQELSLTSSIGISLYPFDGKTPDALLKNADTALHRAKECGRATYRFYTPEMGAQTLKRFTLETALHGALERDEFQLYYQPLVALASGRIVAVEALLRWQPPQGGVIGPAQFIPIAEDNGMIVALGEWVLRAACRQQRQWRASQLPPLRIGVNLSPRQLQHPGLVQTVLAILRDTGCDAGWLDLEITEGVLVRNARGASAVLNELAAAGLHCSIDDFGTGYSSLSYIKHLPIDRLKIDQSFVRDVTEDKGDAAIVSAIINMGRDLGMDVVAEGVETEEQIEFLRGRGCGTAQGFAYCRPVPADELELVLRMTTPASGSPAGPE